jgi:hypothetical protein
MSRTKKPSKLSADERALLNRIRSLNEEETEKLTWEEMIAYLNIMHKIDPRWLRNAFEETFIDRGLTNSDAHHHCHASAANSFRTPARAHYGCVANCK